jgi:hypothetical protein
MEGMKEGTMEGKEWKSRNDVRRTGTCERSNIPSK